MQVTYSNLQLKLITVIRIGFALMQDRANYNIEEAFNGHPGPPPPSSRATEIDGSRFEKRILYYSTLKV